MSSVWPVRDAVVFASRPAHGRSPTVRSPGSLAHPAFPREGGRHVRDPVPVTPGRSTVRPWIDPVVDDDGFDPRSRYVELFWLGVLGPTATWLMRRLVAGLDSPEGYDLDLDATARAMGLSYSADGRHRSARRCSAA